MHFIENYFYLKKKTQLLKYHNIKNLNPMIKIEKNGFVRVEMQYVVDLFNFPTKEIVFACHLITTILIIIVNNY